MQFRVARWMRVAWQSYLAAVMTCSVLSVFCNYKLANFIATYAFNYKEGSIVPPPKAKVVPLFQIDSPGLVCFASFVFLALVMAITVTYAHVRLQRKLRLDQLAEDGIEMAPLASIEDLTASELQSLNSFDILPAIVPSTAATPSSIETKTS